MTTTTPGWSRGTQETNMSILRAAVEAAPDRPFLDFSGDVTTYSEFHDRVMRLAHGLRSRGIGPGDTLVTLLDNNLDAAASWFAANAVGAISVPVNTAYKGEFLRHQIHDSRARIVLAEADYVERVLAVADGLPELVELYARGSWGNDVPPSARLRAGSLDELYADDTSETGFDPKPSDLTFLIYTSGTTGPAKGCMLTHTAAATLGRKVTSMSTRRADEVLWTPLPLFHVNAAAGSMLSTAILAGTVSIYPRFSVSNFWQELERSGASMVSLLGVMLPLIAQMPTNDAMERYHGRLRIAMGAPFPADLVRVWHERFGVELAGSPGYGLTEAAPMVSAPMDSPPVPDASGRRNDNFDVRIFDQDDNELPPGEIGEVVCRPLRPHVMFEGYWHKPEATVAVQRNSWFHTGDLGKFDEDGNFYFVDRKKDYMRRGGENISSQTMESAFRQHPDIEEVAVHAVLSEVSEDEVKVTAVLRAGSTLTERELCEWSMDQVPHFAVPRYVEFRESLPKNPVGRVLKFQLRDEGSTDRTWDRSQALDLVVRR